MVILFPKKKKTKKKAHIVSCMKYLYCFMHEILILFPHKMLLFPFTENQGRHKEEGRGAATVHTNLNTKFKYFEQ